MAPRGIKENKMKRTIAALIGSAFLAAPALAGGPVTPVAELPVEAPPVVTPAANGDWGGAYVGGQLGYADVGSKGNAVTGDGVLGGVQAGYRWDLGKTVLGVEADVSAADASFDGGAGKLDSLARVKLQAGYDMGRTLVYATGGAAYAKADVGGASLSDTGYFGGLGADYALNDRWTVGGEVLMHKFDNFDKSGIDADATTAAVKVNFRF